MLGGVGGAGRVPSIAQSCSEAHLRIYLKGYLFGMHEAQTPALAIYQRVVHAVRPLLCLHGRLNAAPMTVAALTDQLGAGERCASRGREVVRILKVNLP